MTSSRRHHLKVKQNIQHGLFHDLSIQHDIFHNEKEYQQNLTNKVSDTLHLFVHNDAMILFLQSLPLQIAKGLLEAEAEEAGEA